MSHSSAKFEFCFNETKGTQVIKYFLSVPNFRTSEPSDQWTVADPSEDVKSCKIEYSRGERQLHRDYRYMGWCGDHTYSQNVQTVQRSQVPLFDKVL